MADRRGDWIQTYSGGMFWPLDPRSEEINIEDVAHALSMQCRFGGHCLRFYSVAEHSVLVSRVVPPRMALMGLLHDATEAYVADVPRPLKRFLAGYREAEGGVWKAVAARFGLPSDLPPEIKEADDAVLVAEAEQVMASPPTAWSGTQKAARVEVVGMSPHQAKQTFLSRFNELTSEASN
jgi:5'-deoxynucleotidase YfbR-like HD superfamily hydrolase